jgi:hypothetical protein
MHRMQKRKRTSLATLQHRPAKELPLMQRSSSSSTQSSGGFTLPLPPRSRPMIPSSFIDVASSVPPPQNILVLQGSYTTNDDLLADEDMNLHRVRLELARRSEAAQIVSQAYTRRMAYARNCSTLGRNWRSETKARGAIPGPLFTLRDGHPQWDQPTTKTAMEQYLESGGRVVGPLSDAFTAQRDSNSRRHHRTFMSLREISETCDNTGSGAVLCRLERKIIHGPQKVQLPHAVPPPVIAVLPKSRGATSIMGVPESQGGQHRSPVFETSIRGRSKVRSTSMSSLMTSPRSSFHRDRCGIAGCSSGRRRRGSMGWISGSLYDNASMVTGP